MPDLDALFGTFERTAFRLECLGRDAGPDEASAFASFLSGRPHDLAWHQPWLDAIRRAVDAGRLVQRVRVVDEPPTPYEHFELALGRFHLAAGEDLRVLPAPTARALGIPPIDFWLLDDARVVSMDFDADGAFLGSEVTNDPGVLRHLRRVRDRALEHALPYAAYVETRPFPEDV
jgi:hypothetical protein